jgi:hypothetical protein
MQSCLRSPKMMTVCYDILMNQVIGADPVNDLLYRSVRWFGAPLRFRSCGTENIIDRGPAIYTCNHLASEGPMAAILSLPIRFYTWTIAEMMDFQRASQYLFDDFVHPVWHLDGRFGHSVSFLVSRITVVLLTGLGSISVDRSRGGFSEPFRRSLDLLKVGKNLLIFPEDSKAPLDPKVQMRPFLVGYTWLCHLYFKETGQHLPVYPLAVYPKKRVVCVGKPQYFVSEGDPRQQIRVFGRQVECEVQLLYQSLAIS